MAHGGGKQLQVRVKFSDSFSTKRPHLKRDDMVQIHSSGRGRPSILLVDDCEHHRHIMTFLLDGLEANIVTASDGAEALKIISAGEKRFDLILMDDAMPNMDGLEATAAIRQFDRTTPVVFCTSRTILKTHRQAVDIGANGMVEKPVYGTSLNRAIQAYI